jgi:hypothetical protein
MLEQMPHRIITPLSPSSTDTDEMADHPPNLVPGLGDRLLALAGMRADEALLVMVYGSAVSSLAAARDIDALVVAPRKRPRFVSGEAYGHEVNLHVVPPAAVDADIVRDRYGWMFLTKFLSDKAVFVGDSTAAARWTNLSYLRLLGQWCAEHSQCDVPLAAAAGILLDVLTRWNPQFEHYSHTGRISVQTFADQLPTVLDSSEALRHGHLHDEWFTFRTSSRLRVHADLRTIVVRYWVFYFLHHRHDGDYIPAEVLDILDWKGVHR